MKRLIITILAALAIAPIANAQVLFDLSAGSDTVEVTHAQTAQAEAPAVEAVSVAAQEDTQTNSGPSSRPGIPDPPTGLSRAQVPCGGARSCDGNPLPVVARPPVPPLVVFSADLNIEGTTNPFSCFITFTAKVPGDATGDEIVLGRRDLNSTGVYVPTLTIYTANGTATLKLPAKMASGEWLATETATREKSAPVTVTSALPPLCG